MAGQSILIDQHSQLSMILTDSRDHVGEHRIMILLRVVFRETQHNLFPLGVQLAFTRDCARPAMLFAIVIGFQPPRARCCQPRGFEHPLGPQHTPVCTRPGCSPRMANGSGQPLDCGPLHRHQSADPAKPERTRQNNPPSAQNPSFAYKPATSAGNNRPPSGLIAEHIVCVRDGGIVNNMLI